MHVHMCVMVLIVPYRFFVIPVRTSAGAEEELNRFLRCHRVLSVDRRWVDEGSESFWSFCVDYLETGQDGRAAGWRKRAGQGRLPGSSEPRAVRAICQAAGPEAGDCQGRSGSRLRVARDQIGEFLVHELCLELKPDPYINRCRVGMDFLGCRIYPSHTTLNRRSRIRFQRQLKRLVREHQRGNLGSPELQCRTTALVAFTNAGRTASWRWRNRVLAQLPHW